MKVLGNATLSNFTSGGQTMLAVQSNATNAGMKLNILNIALNVNNTFEIDATYLSRDAEYLLKIVEYNYDDSVVHAEKVIDRDGIYTLQFKPNGTGNVKALLLQKSALQGAIVHVKSLKTTITNYTASQVFTTICNGGGDRYRFGYNGKEKDNELKGIGNTLDYGLRMYDSRLCRFFARDPLIKKYPYLTSYAFAENDPINFVDLDGGEKAKYCGLLYKIQVVDGHGNVVTQAGKEYDYKQESRKSNQEHQDIFRDKNKVVTGEYQRGATSPGCGTVVRTVTYKELPGGQGVQLMSVEDGDEPPAQVSSTTEQSTTCSMTLNFPTFTHNGGNLSATVNNVPEASSLPNSDVSALKDLINGMMSSTTSPDYSYTNTNGQTITSGPTNTTTEITNLEITITTPNNNLTLMNSGALNRVMSARELSISSIITDCGIPQERIEISTQRNVPGNPSVIITGTTKTTTTTSPASTTTDPSCTPRK